MASRGGIHRIFPRLIAMAIALASNAAFPLAPLVTQAASPGAALSVDATASRRAISPYIYGMNYADPTLAQELHIGVDRRGGNETSRYNWTNNISNHADDYYFENIPDDISADQFVTTDRAHGVSSMITMPLIGYVAKTSNTTHPYACGFKVSVYGPQQSVDPYDTDCGNGLHTDGTNITGNNPLDTSIATTPAFDQTWVQHLATTFGSAANGGVGFYDLDNEPVLWDSTHRDVHPNPPTYDELIGKALAYAPAIKAGDPSAKTLGPSDWGWPAYLDTNVAGDRAAHGNIPLGRWYLQQMHAYEQQHGIRILDYFDEHFYPQENGVALSSAGNAGTQALRLRSTRALWDPTYVDESWINTVVDWIPTARSWIASDYPGTKLAITEYNWGGLESVNGALAEADVLGIFGREGVDLATIWDPPTSGQPGAYAFRMYRDYDGNGAVFGDVSIQSTSADQGSLAIYGAERTADNALTLMIVNKTGANLTSTLSLAHYQPIPTANVYTYSAANLTAITHQQALPVTAAGFTATFAANSITLVVLTQSTASTITTITPTSGPMIGGTPVTITGTGFVPGATVTFGTASPMAATVTSATMLQVTTPPSATPGLTDIVVTTTAGTSLLYHGFTYVPPNPLPSTSGRATTQADPSPPSGLPPPRTGPASTDMPAPAPPGR